MEYAIRLLEQEMANLICYNIRAKRFKGDDANREIKYNQEKMEQLEAAIAKLKGE